MGRERRVGRGPGLGLAGRGETIPGARADDAARAVSRAHAGAGAVHRDAANITKLHEAAL